MEALYKLRREHPKLTVKSLIGELVRQGMQESGTLWQHDFAGGWSKRACKGRACAGSELSRGPTKAFALPLPNLLWTADCMHGPTLKTGGEIVQPTYRFALLDDVRGCVCTGGFTRTSDWSVCLNTLRRSVQTWSLPGKSPMR